MIRLDVSTKLCDMEALNSVEATFPTGLWVWKDHALAQFGWG
jgi:hypothetical protein